MITITFLCGHQCKADGSESNLACPQCAERKVVHVEAPLPTFRGTVTGPHAQYQSLEPKAVTLEAEKTHD